VYKAPATATHDVASPAGVRRRCRDLLAVDGVMSAHVTASIANEAAKLPAWSAMVVDDFHNAVPAVSGNMIDLDDRWLAFFNGKGEALLPRPDTRARPVPDV